MSGEQPTADELRSHLKGLLPSARAAELDAWLADQPDAEVERLLAMSGGDADGGILAAQAGQGGSRPGYVSEAPGSRFSTDGEIGAGGMAVVQAARDRVLDRSVALKVLRPRQPGESLEGYHLREAAFRREAAITAGLEHPAIVPVHDVGRCDGRPAFTMKRLDGRTLDQVLHDGTTSPADLLPALLRVAEAIAYAHSRGVVHRDLTPANIVLGDFGAVHVLDWGVAARIGAGAGEHAGTPAWMAPEQQTGAPADPRMDVYALGGLLAALWSRQAPPRDTITLDPRIPRGLAALIHRCRASDPAARLPDGGAVADELRRWMDEGLTLAQEASRWELAWLRLRRSPRAMTALGAVFLALAGAATGWWWSGREERIQLLRRLEVIAATTLIDRPEAVRPALDEVRLIRHDHPDLDAAMHQEARLSAALDLALARERDAALLARLDGLLARTRRIGPWADQVQAWRDALAALGLRMDAASATMDAERMRRSPLVTTVAAALAFLWRAERECGRDTEAAIAAQLLAAGGPSPGWQGLGRQLEQTRFSAHDPVFCVCADSAAALLDPGSAAVALALFGPEPRLEDYARRRLLADPGDFWPLVACARAALAHGDHHTTERLALVASGAEPASLIPLLLLAYVDLVRSDWKDLLAVVDRGLAIDAANVELLALRTVALVGTGDRAGAERLLATLPAGHLRYHLSHRVGHPMERTVDALVAAGLTIPEAPPDLGPLSPHQHHH